MAYTHSKYEVQMIPAGRPTSVASVAERGAVNLGVTGVQAVWSPGFVPHIIKGAAVIPFVTTALTNAAIYSFRADISIAGTPTEMFVIRQPTAIADTVHKSHFYTPTFFIEILPGHVVDFNVTAVGSGNGIVILYVEPRWEEAANVTSMRATT